MKKRDLRPIIGTGAELGMTMGLTAAGCVLLGLFAGRWLDAKLNTSPIATILLLLAGAIAGQVALYRLATRTTRQLTDDPEKELSAREGLKAMGVTLGGLALVTLPPLVAVAVGMWLDRLLGTDAVITVVLVLVGLVAGIYGALRLFHAMDSDTEEDDASCASEES